MRMLAYARSDTLPRGKDCRRALAAPMAAARGVAAEITTARGRRRLFDAFDDLFWDKLR
jgi:hypothetical protein